MTQNPDSLALLSTLPAFTPKKLARLLESGESPASLVTQNFPSPHAAWSQLQKNLQTLRATFISRTDNTYPSSRLSVLGLDTPLGLYTRGGLALDKLLAAPTVAIIGTRKTTDYGRRAAFSLAHDLAGGGATIISGMALGIDTAAHEGALEAKGNTLAVLGAGVDVCYPTENQKLFDTLIARGLLISETSLGRAPEAYLFPLRNRIVAALADIVIVIESDIKGGAMITARLAQNFGRPLCAYPGRTDQRTSAGPHRLIQEGAHLITCAQDIWGILRATPTTQTELFSTAPAKKSSKKSTKKIAPTKPPAFLTPLLEGDALTPETLAERAGLPITSLLPSLLEYELLGLLSKNLDGRYEWHG